MKAQLMVKCFELRFKNTNELIWSSISEGAIRKEWLRMKEDGDDMSNVVANQTFIAQAEWNNAINNAFTALVK